MVSVADNLSGSVESISASPGCTEAGGILSCEVLDLAPGASIALEIVVRLTQCGTITNTVTIEDSDPIDRFYSSSVIGSIPPLFDPRENNTDAATTTVIACPVENPQSAGSPSITQKSEQDVESGNASQTFDVS